MSQNPASLNHTPGKLNAPQEEWADPAVPEETTMAQADGRSARRLALRTDANEAASTSRFTHAERMAAQALIESITGA